MRVLALLLFLPFLSACGPYHAIDHSKSALASYEKGDYQGAIADYSKAIELDPAHAYAYLNRGLAYKALFKLPEARADLEKAMELARPQNNPEAYAGARFELAKLPIN